MTTLFPQPTGSCKTSRSMRPPLPSADQPVARCCWEVIPNFSLPSWSSSMQSSSTGHPVMKLFTAPVPKPANQKNQRWSAVNHKSWDKELHRAWGVDRNTTPGFVSNCIRSSFYHRPFPTPLRRSACKIQQCKSQWSQKTARKTTYTP